MRDAYPALEAVPKFRWSARWECRWPEVAQGSHRRPGHPSPIVAPDLSRRTEAHFRLGDSATRAQPFARLQRYLNCTGRSRISPNAVPPEHDKPSAAPTTA